MDRHTIVLVSGGIDSSATVAVCQDAKPKVSSLFFDYGQPAALSEWEAAQRIASHYQIDIDKVNLGATLVSNGGEFFGRNALFILMAAGTVIQRPLTIALGIHALTDYYDTTPLFVRHMQRVLNGYSGGMVTLYAPFLASTKPELVQFARLEAVPLDLTYSCERQNAPACADCPSCRDRIDIDGP